MTMISVNYSLFSTDDGEYFTGSGTYSIEDFADFISGELRGALVELLNENPYKVFSLVIDSSKGEREE